VVHIEEVEEVQDLIDADPVSLNIFRRAGFLRNQGTNDGKDCKQNEERNGEFEGPKKIKDDGKKSTFFHVDCWL
jgi:hypothetical protein